jgi:hypothetical protein
VNLAFFGEEHRVPSGNVRQAIGYGKEISSYCVNFRYTTILQPRVIKALYI